jgi:hypothetical protein
MKIPYIKYVEALVCSKLPKDEIQDRLDVQEFFSSFTEIDQVHTMLSQVNPDYILKNQPDPNWLIEMRVDKMVAYNRKLEMPNGTFGIEGAFRLLEDPLMYRLITSLALAKITDEDIELIVNGKYNINYTSEDITEFLHYFFNVKSWTLTDKVQYVESIKSNDLKKFYKMALKGDKDHLVWKLGAAPNKSFDSMLREIMTDSFYNFKENSKVNSDIAQKWGTLALKTVEKLEKFDKSTQEKKDVFAEITFKLNKTKKDREQGKKKEDLPVTEGPLQKPEVKEKFKHITELG